MRSLLATSAIVLAVLALTGASAAAHRDLFKEDAHEKAETMKADAVKHIMSRTAHHAAKIKAATAAAAHLAKSPAAHGFAAQQTTELFNPASDATQCTDGSYSKAVLVAFLACTGVTIPISESYATDALANADWTTFCASSCLTGFKDTLVGTDFDVCQQPDLKFFVQSSIFFCDTVSTTGGEKCGVSYHRLNRYATCSTLPYETTVTSGNRTYTGTSPPTTGYTCDMASDVCESTTKTVESAESSTSVKTCRSIYSSSVSAAACDGGCLAGFAAVADATVPGTEVASGVALLGSLSCSKDSTGSYCAATMSATRNAFEDGTASSTTYSTMCASADILSCYRKSVGIAYGLGAAAIKASFQTCAISVKNETTAVNAYCLPSFTAAMAAIAEGRSTSSKLCVTNAAGDYCGLLGAALKASTCYSYATSPWTKTNCTNMYPECAATLNTMVTDMGCCAGLLQEDYSAAQTLSVEDFPKVIGYTPTAITVSSPLASTAPVTVGDQVLVTSTSGSGFIADLAFCGATDLNQTLSTRCALSTVTVAKKLGLKIKWSALSADATLMAKILTSVRTDVADNLGLSSSEIVNDMLVENSALQVTTTARRSFTLQAAGTSSGTSYEFEIQAADETSTTAAASSYDSLEADNSFVMTETSATTTDECGDACTDSTTSLTATSTSTSSGAAFVGFTAVVATLFAALIM